MKGAAEQRMMREAARVSADAHCRAMRRVHDGTNEGVLEAELFLAFREGARAAAYESIVAGGEQRTMHYVRNDALLRDGELVLVDAGCEYGGYAADIRGRFRCGHLRTVAARLYALCWRHSRQLSMRSDPERASMRRTKPPTVC